MFEINIKCPERLIWGQNICIQWNQHQRSWETYLGPKHLYPVKSTSNVLRDLPGAKTSVSSEINIKGPERLTWGQNICIQWNQHQRSWETYLGPKHLYPVKSTSNVLRDLPGAKTSVSSEINIKCPERLTWGQNICIQWNQHQMSWETYLGPKHLYPVKSTSKVLRDLPGAKTSVSSEINIKGPERLTWGQNICIQWNQHQRSWETYLGPKHLYPVKSTSKVLRDLPGAKTSVSSEINIKCPERLTWGQNICIQWNQHQMSWETYLGPKHLYPVKSTSNVLRDLPGAKTSVSSEINIKCSERLTWGQNICIQWNQHQMSWEIYLGPKHLYPVKCPERLTWGQNICIQWNQYQMSWETYLGPKHLYPVKSTSNVLRDLPGAKTSVSSEINIKCPERLTWGQNICIQWNQYQISWEIYLGPKYLYPVKSTSNVLRDLPGAKISVSSEINIKCLERFTWGQNICIQWNQHQMSWETYLGPKYLYPVKSTSNVLRDLPGAKISVSSQKFCLISKYKIKIISPAQPCKFPIQNYYLS